MRILGFLSETFEMQHSPFALRLCLGEILERSILTFFFFMGKHLEHLLILKNDEHFLINLKLTSQ